MDLDHKLCYCFHISKRKIVNFVKQTRPRRASQISECFGAGSGCGWCIPFLVEIHRRILAGDAVGPDSTTPGEYEALRSGYLAGIKDGSSERNSYRQATAADAPVPTTPAATEPIGEEALDYMRYFSRSRPEPPPDELRADTEREASPGDDRDGEEDS